mmetsp:Transcript_17956/g.44500  ORF Transcript_17956/g.44500 Transcript_17956/m.44500 type:complete len:231 (-) Transcript_17956:24-716(-)
MRRAVAGNRLSSALMSLVARNLARSSTARPKSTNANSMTGSSKNVGHPRAGISTAAVLMPKDASAPNDTSVFMLGPPARRERHPSTSVSRPGPRSAKTDRPACTGVLHNTDSHGALLWKRCAAWPTRQVAASAHATTTRRVLSAMRSIRASRLLRAASELVTPATAIPHASRTDVGNPLAVTASASKSPLARTAFTKDASNCPPRLAPTPALAGRAPPPPPSPPPRTVCP